LLSFRLTAGTVPMALRDMAFTAVVARNGLGFFFFGTAQEFNRKGRKGRNAKNRPISASELTFAWLA